jgi:hypothetical protein
VACATRAPPWKTLAAQFITYPASISVQSDGASSDDFGDRSAKFLAQEQLSRIGLAG